MMHRAVELVDSSDMDDAESARGGEFEGAHACAIEPPACSDVAPTKRQQHNGDISPMLMLGHHNGKTFQNATEADPQYYFWGANQSKPGIFLKVYLGWVKIHYAAEPTGRVQKAILG